MLMTVITDLKPDTAYKSQQDNHITMKVMFDRWSKRWAKRRKDFLLTNLCVQSPCRPILPIGALSVSYHTNDSGLLLCVSVFKSTASRWRTKCVQYERCAASYLRCLRASGCLKHYCLSTFVVCHSARTLCAVPQAAQRSV